MSVQHFDKVEVLRDNIWGNLVVVQCLQHLSTPHLLEEIRMVLVHCLLMLSNLLDKLSSWLNNVLGWIHKWSNLHCFNIGLVEELVIRHYLYLSIKVRRYDEQLLRGSHTKCNVLRIFFILVDKLLLSIALYDIFWLQTIHAVVVEKEEISCVKRFLNLN